MHHLQLPVFQMVSLQTFVETSAFPDLTSLWDGRPTFAVFVTIFAVAITSIIYALYLHPLFVSPLRHLPGPPLLYNPLGNFLDLVVAEPGTVSTAWADKHGPVVKIVGPFGVSSLFLFRPEALRKILITDAEDYPRPRLARDVLRLTTGYGLLATAGAEHSALRKLVSPAFSISNVNSQNDIYFKYINELVPDMLQQLETEPHGKVVYTSQWVGNLTLQIISETAFGYLTDSGKESHVEIMEAYDAMAALQSGTTISMMFALMGIPGMSAFTRSKLGLKLHWVFQAIPLLAPASTLVRYAHRLREVSARILRDRIKESELHPEDFEDKKDVMSQLLRGRNALEIKDGQRMTDEDIVEHVMTFMGAGQETTASGISWTLWFLATHRDVQQKLREEVTPIFEAGPCPDYKEFKDLKMLDCVVMESLRLLPPAPISVRQATKDDYIDGTFVPKGTLLYIPTRSIHMWKEVWGSDAEDFRPERWLDLPPNYDSSLSFLAFLAGPSGCIGKVMAMSEMKAILAALITNFDFSPAFEGQGIKPSSAITMNPKDNMPLLIKPVRRT